MDNEKGHLRGFRTYGQSKAVRLDDFDYAADADIHLTLCSVHPVAFSEPGFARVVCESVEFYSKKLHYDLYGYCLMPDHLHVLLSPASSGLQIGRWLQGFKSYTAHLFAKEHQGSTLWQRSAYDHVCRSHETGETVLGS